MTKDEVINTIQRAYEKLDDIEDEVRRCRKILDELPGDSTDIDDDEKGEK